MSAFLVTPMLLSLNVCETCGFDTVRDAQGRCGFCFPAYRVREHRCDTCANVIEKPQHNQRFCSTNCKDTAWRRTPTGYAWAEERNRRRRAA